MRKLVFICMYLSLTVPCAAGTIYVSVSTAGANDGSSWTDAYNYLQDALADANSMDKPVEIWVTEGTYYPDPNGLADPREASFQMKNGAAIYGGFSNTGDPGWANRDPNQYETILSGDLLGNDDPNTHIEDLFTDPTRDDNCYHVFYHPASLALDPNAILDGFTITAANADGSFPHASGGGMLNYYYNSPTVTNCTFSGNSADYGGGMCNSESSPTVTNCTFTGNSGDGMYNEEAGNPTVIACTFAENSGSGVENSQSSPTVTNCTFTGNTAYRGGGMSNEHNSSPTVINCTFIGNSASSKGGGMSNQEYSSPIVTGCTFTNNSGVYAGGGMYNDHHSNPIVTSCTFTNNSVNSSNDYSGGGGIRNDRSSPMVTNCTFTGNSAFNDGGGMHNYDESSPTLTGCTFTENSADAGGGMVNSSSSPTITDCVFNGNLGAYGGGGMVNSSSNPTITGCIFTGNSAPDGSGGGMANDYFFLTVTGCIFTGNTAQDGGGIFNYSASPAITNCTFTGNSVTSEFYGYGGAICHSKAVSPITVTNCILWDNTASLGGNQIAIQYSSSPMNISFCDIKGGLAGIYDDASSTINWGTGNIDADPLFVDTASSDPNLWDFHLRSAGWRWDNDANQWTWDDVTSPCIDAGNPGALLGNEPMTLDVDPLNRWGENLRINMGACGGTVEASMPPPDWALLADLTNDGIVNLADFANQAQDWQQTQNAQPGDLNRNETVDLYDALLMANDWLKTTSWH